MRIHIVQHTAGTPPGSTLEWLEKRGLAFTHTRFFAGEKLPAPSDVDWAIVLGGGMNVDQEDKHPWLRDEKNWLVDLLNKDNAVLGLCLGGQLLAEVLGARVGRHPDWEIGWHPVRFNDGSRLTAFQWHGYSFDTPAGAERIATSEGCAHQGFTLGGKVIGLQFHPETTEAWVRELCAEYDAKPGPFVQKPDEILAGLGHLAALQGWYFKLLDNVANRVRG